MFHLNSHNQHHILLQLTVTESYIHKGSLTQHFSPVKHVHFPFANNSRCSINNIRTNNCFKQNLHFAQNVHLLYNSEYLHTLNNAW